MDYQIQQTGVFSAAQLKQLLLREILNFISKLTFFLSVISDLVNNIEIIVILRNIGPDMQHFFKGL